MAQAKNRGRTPEWLRRVSDTSMLALSAATGAPLPERLRGVSGTGMGPFSLPESSNWAAPAARLAGGAERSKQADAMRQEDRAESREGGPQARLTGEVDMLREHAGKNWGLAKGLEGDMNKMLSGVRSAADKAADEFNAFNSGKSKLTPEQTIEMTNRMNELNKGFAGTLYSASDGKVVHGGGNDVSSYDYQEQRGRIYREYLDKAKGNLAASNAETERTQFETSGKGMADEQMAAVAPPSRSLAEIAQDTNAKAAAHASDLRMANERKNETENKALAGRIRDSHQSTDSFISDVKRDVSDAIAGKGASPAANGPSITLSQEAAAAYQKNTGANPLSGNGMASAYVSSGGARSAFESSSRRKNGGMYADYDGGVTSDSADQILSSYEGGDESNRQYRLDEKTGGFGMSEWLDVARRIMDSEAPLSIRGTEMEDGWRDAEIRRSIPADVISAISGRASSLGNNGREDGGEQNSGALAESGVSHATGTDKPGAAELLRITDRVPMTPSTLATIVSDDEALDAAMTDGADGRRTLYLGEEERRRYDDIRKEFRKKNGRDMDDMTARLRAMRGTRGDAEVKKLAIALRRRRDAALASAMGLDRDAPLAGVDPDEVNNTRLLAILGSGGR